MEVEVRGQLVLSSIHHVVARDQTQVIRFHGLDPLDHLCDPLFLFLYIPPMLLWFHFFFKPTQYKTTYNHFYICPLSNSLARLKRSSHFCNVPKHLSYFQTLKLPVPMTSHFLGIPYLCMRYSIGLYSLCPTLHHSFLPAYPSFRVPPGASLGSSTPLRGPDISREHAFTTVSSGPDTNA